MNARGIVVSLLTCAALAACGSSETGGSSGETKSSASPYSASPTGAIAAARKRTNDAYALCVDRVTERLKAPATARFSARDRDHEAQDGNRYLFTGTVDSENSFGALLRADFGCDIRWTGSEFVADSVTVS